MGVRRFSVFCEKNAIMIHEVFDFSKNLVLIAGT